MIPLWENPHHEHQLLLPVFQLTQIQFVPDFISCFHSLVIQSNLFVMQISMKEQASRFLSANEKWQRCTNSSLNRTSVRSTAKKMEKDMRRAVGGRNGMGWGGGEGGRVGMGMYWNSDARRTWESSHGKEPSAYVYVFSVVYRIVSVLRRVCRRRRRPTCP